MSLVDEAERDIAYDPEPIGRYNVACGTKVLLLSERVKHAPRSDKQGIDPQGRMAHSDAKLTRIYIQDYIHWVVVLLGKQRLVSKFCGIHVSYAPIILRFLQRLELKEAFKYVQ